MKLSNETYDLLKFLAIYVVPSVETFWLAIGVVWDIPYTAEVGTTIGAIGLLIAGCIGMSVSAYEEEKKEKHEGNANDGD